MDHLKIINTLLQDLVQAGVKVTSDFSESYAHTIHPRLVDFTILLEKWNKAHDLVSQKTYEDIFNHHIIDCLMAFIIQSSRNSKVPDTYIDIGTGAGLPGIVWHLCFNQKAKTILFEPRAKRVNFLKEVRRSLNLENLEIVESRFNYQPTIKNTAIATLRALKPDKQMLTEFLSVTAEKSEIIWLASDGTLIDNNDFGVKVEQVKYNYTVVEKFQRMLICFSK